MSHSTSPTDSTAVKLPRIRIPSWLWIAFLIVGVGAVGGLFGASKLEENDAFCASCHTQPETTYYERSIAASPVDLASYHHSETTRCIDCHSGPGIAGRIDGMTIGALDMIAFLSGTAKQPAPLTHPIADQNCTKCHTDTTSTQDFRRHFHAFLPQWQQMDANAATCVTCHVAHSGDGSPSLGYLPEKTVVNTCNNCHNAAGMEDD